MEAPASRGTRRRLRAGSIVLVATVCSLLFAAPVYADPEEGESTEPVEVPSSEAPPTQDPTTDAPATTDPPTQDPTTEAPPVIHNFRMTVSKVEVGDAYWQGDGSAELVIAIKNTGSNVGNDTTTGFYNFPSGAQAVGAYGTDGCSTSNGTLSFSCTLDEGRIGRVVLKVNVDPGAWKLSDFGIVTASMSGGPTKTAPIQIVFNTKPPTPGIELSASPLALPAQATPRAESAQLQIKLRNTGTTKANGAIEVVTPPGVDVVTFPTVCRSHRKIAPDRDRCEFGDIAGGKDVTAAFGLTISAAARAEVPLTGAVHGYITPIGRDTIETRSDYLITAPPVVGESPLPTDAPASPVAGPAVAGTGDDPGKQQRATGGLLASEQLSSAPFIIGIIGLVGIVGFLVVFSLRRRLRDDASGPPVDPEDEPRVLVPAHVTGAEDTPTPTPLPRSPIPRAIILPRLPTGPVAGSGFRAPQDAEED